MIIYCDSSALVKKYIEEENSQKVIEYLNQAESIVISVIGYAEICSAFYRKKYQKEIHSSQLTKILRALDNDWQAFVRVNVTEELNKMAKLLLSKHPLRGFDAIHLASAVLMHKKLEDKIYFLSYDQKQSQAAELENLLSLTSF